MANDKIWSALFAGATAILMLGILLLRSTVPPTWAMLAFPAVGALLALAASRTSPNRSQIMWLETSTIAAACVVVLVLVINGLLIDLFVGAFGESARGDGRTGILLIIVLAACSAMLWWALERRVRRLRENVDMPPVQRAGAGATADELTDTV